ncbi:MAG: ComEC/Rec2 family competence protein [Sphingobium sp.]
MASSLSQTDVAVHRIFGAPGVQHRLESWLEAERERIGLWVPVMLGCGIAAWFALPDSRWWAAWIVLCSLVALGCAFLKAGGRLPMPAMNGALLAAVGCAIIWGKALIGGAPPLERPVFARFEARVLAVEAQPALARVRVMLEPRDRAQAFPRRVRVNIDEAEIPAGLGPDAVIAVRARLMTPAPPAVPGAYDFAERAFFQGIGATGRALPPVKVISAAPVRAVPLRQSLGAHIRERLPASEGAIASTLATGDRGAIAREDEEAMRRSGLAHLLSISGLHVSAVIAAAIVLTYRLLALWPRLALTVPLMLVSAGVGAATGIGYTLLTGAQVPTVRSCIAALLVLGGLALGREAISLRLIAAGAIIVLLIWPESLVGPSFQMSFAAVTVIVALAETRWFRDLTQRRDEAFAWRLGRTTLALFLTGAAVEIALTPIALHHFHQAGMLGAFANLVAIPLTTFVIMPAEVLALLFDVAGMGAPFWWIVGKAIGLLIGLAHFVARQPLAVWPLPVSATAAFSATVFGGLWFLLWRTRVRLFGLLPVAVGAVAMIAAPLPDLLVTGDGRHLAVRQEDGRLALLRGRAGDYVRDMFSASAGNGSGKTDDGEDMIPLEDTANARCSRDICSVLVRRPERDWLVVATRTGVRVPWRALVDLCAQADIVVSDRRLPAGCVPRWLKLDRTHLARTGGTAIYLEEHRWESVTNAADRHPWVAKPSLPHNRREAAASAQL